MYSPQQLDELTLIFNTQGYLHLRGAIAPTLLARIKTAFDAAAQAQLEAWRVAAPKHGEPLYVDIPAILDQDQAFIDLVDMPSIFRLLVAVIGDDLQLTQTMARLFHPGPTFTAPFHSDLAHVQGVSLEHTPNFLVKAHYYMEDLSADQGCLAFIPGSQRLPAGHPKAAHLRDENSEAAVKIVPRAGDVVIFNTHVLHMALDNNSDAVRKSIIYAFSHFWMKQDRSAIPHPRAHGNFCRQRAQLFGIDEVGVPHFNRRLAAAPNGYAQLVMKGKSMLKRSLRMR